MGRMMVFLVSHAPGGGAQEVWANLADGFRTRGNTVTLLALYPLYRTADDESRETVWSYVVPRKPDTILGHVGLVRQLIRRLRQIKPTDLLTAMPAANVIGPLAACFVRLPTRCIIAHHSPAETHSPWLTRLDRLTGLLRNVRHIVCVSHAVAQTVRIGKADGYKDKMCVINNALPPVIEQRLAELLARRAGRAARRRIVATGRLSAEKNYPLLLEAIARVPDVHLQIIGSGPMEAELVDQTRRLAIDDRVQFFGRRSRLETLDALADADVFVQPSLFEGHSLSLIEATKLHLPLIVSDASAQIEAVTTPDGVRRAQVVSSRDTDGLAKAIAAVLDDPDALQMWSARSAELGRRATFSHMLDGYDRLVSPQD
jgi:glycosyltransferase involved in cell wall biosynthesis